MIPNGHKSFGMAQNYLGKKWFKLTHRKQFGIGFQFIS